jgi:hypothetical protein
VVTPGGTVETATENIGARGCQVVLPSAVQRGITVGLTVSAPRVPATLRIEGRVAWVSPQAPWRVGIAYTPAGLNEAARWLETVRQAAPELFPPGRRTHDRVAVDAMVFLGVAPRLPDFTDDEITVLRKVWAGLRVTELRASFADRWAHAQRSFFALLAQGHLTLSRAASAHPLAWRDVLGEHRPAAAPQTSVGLQASAATTPVPTAAAVPRPAAATPPPLPTTRPTVPATPVPPPLPIPNAPASTPTRPAVEAPRRAGPPTPDFVGAGVGWRGGSTARSPGADALFQQALVELQHRNHHQALKLLRSALTLAPGDKEIAEAIGRAMGSGG